jgi:hypothetical protein
MTDDQIRDYLRHNGYAEHLWHEGRAGLVQRWRTFVEEVEKGYPLGLYDYRNDLDLRSVLSEVGLDNDVKDLDERFEKLLKDRKKRVWESAKSDAFWIFGYPKNASGELLEDLKSEGLV